MGLALLTPVVLSRDANGLEEDGLTDDEYAIYTTAMRESADGLLADRTKNLTGTFDQAELVVKLGAHLETFGRDRAVIESYMDVYLDSVPIDPRLLRIPATRMIPLEKAQNPSPKWQTVLFFSRVGFNDDRSKAMMFFALTCGGLCGYGDFLFLERTTSGWKIVSREREWIS